ncbi:MAG: dihydropteroate synthase, partial [Patescibacteria group bacterium]
MEITREKTAIVGILNVTADSFSDGGAYLDIEKAIAHAHR